MPQGEHVPSVAVPRESLVITVANTVFLDKVAGICRLLESAAHNRVAVEVLGLGEPWHGFSTKLQHVIRRLSKPDIADDTVVMFVDAFDVSIVHPWPVILAKFKAMNRSLVFGAECTVSRRSRVVNATV